MRRGLQEQRAGDQAQRADLLALLGYASHALSTLDLLGVPVPTLRLTTDAASFELCVCGHAAESEVKRDLTDRGGVVWG